MFLQIAEVLGPEELRLAQRVFAGAAFEDGRKTAGAHARAVKRNEQAGRGPLRDQVLKLIERRLLDHDLFRAAARPKALVRLLLSRYQPGMAYGLHVDDAVMDGQRTDLSFTLFLNDPQSYEGGELVVEEPAGERLVKLKAGDLVLYPSDSLHRVAEVRAGTRCAAVGWVRSQVRDPQAREVLFDLALARQRAAALLAARRDGQGLDGQGLDGQGLDGRGLDGRGLDGRALLDRLDKVSGQLLRRWVED